MLGVVFGGVLCFFWRSREKEFVCFLFELSLGDSVRRFTVSTTTRSQSECFDCDDAIVIPSNRFFIVCFFPSTTISDD